MKVILFVIFLFFFRSCFSQLKTITYLHDSENNTFTNFLYDCTRKADTTFTGIDTFFFQLTSKMKVLIEYKSGFKTKATCYYENNQIYKEINFNGKEIHGLELQWYKNGQICLQNYYENSKLVTSLQWSEMGDLEGIIYHNPEKNNSGFSKGFHKNGLVQCNNYYIDSTKGGFIEIFYYEDGQIFSKTAENAGMQSYEEFYKNGQKHKQGKIFNLFFSFCGHWQEWYKTGILKRDYYFHDSIPNQKEGTWKWFDEKGNLTKEEYYKNGEKTGEKEFVPGKKQNEKMK